MSDIEKLTALAIDCGYRIHRDLGPGLLESVYETLLAAKLARSGVRVERQKPIDFEYDGIRVREGFRADRLVEAVSLSRSRRRNGLQPFIPGNCSLICGFSICLWGY